MRRLDTMRRLNHTTQCDNQINTVFPTVDNLRIGGARDANTYAIVSPTRFVTMQVETPLLGPLE